jgi:hypothetical protein
LPETGTIKTEFGQVKIMKEFVWINRKFFGQGEKMKAKTAEQVVCLIHVELTSYFAFRSINPIVDWNIMKETYHNGYC